MQICDYLNKGGWTSERDPDQKAIYSYTDRLWVGYDDLESINIKVVSAAERRKLNITSGNI